MFQPYCRGVVGEVEGVEDVEFGVVSGGGGFGGGVAIGLLPVDVVSEFAEGLEMALEVDLTELLEGDNTVSPLRLSARL